jgi:hypothetical protein
MKNLISMKTTFTPTQEQIRAAVAVFISMAHEQTMKEIVEGYQAKVLKRHNFKDSFNGTIITDPRKAWGMSEEDFKVYLEECNTEREIAGLKVQSDDRCPLLEAQSMLSKARRNLIDVCSPTFRVSAGDLLCRSLDKYNAYVELLLKWIAPFCKGELRSTLIKIDS